MCRREVSTILEQIREKVQYLFETAPQIHMNVSITHPKVELQNAPAVIIGVYRNVFRIEETSTGIVRTHTLQYADMVTDRIKILEMK